jgi:hypothetical protein
MVSSWNGRFSLFVRDRSHRQNSLIIIARSCAPVISAGGAPTTAKCEDRVATRSGDFRGRSGTGVLRGMLISSLLGELCTFSGPEAMYTAPGC